MSQTYKRDTRVTFTDMCIYIDNNIYSDNFDVDKCYQYMYHIFYTLAVKNRFFNTAKDYDEYALFGATRLFLRYQKRQLKVIKSVLNYVNRILYPTKVEYQAQTFNQVFKKDVEDDLTKTIEHELYSKAANQTDGMKRADFEYYLNKIPSTIKRYMKELPYYKDKALIHNIYLSCILSVLNAFTMSRDNKKRYEKKARKNLPIDNLLETIYREERKDAVILYNLDSSMYNYISTLVNRIFTMIKKDLIYLLGSYEPSDAIIMSILSSPLDDNMEGMN